MLNPNADWGTDSRATRIKSSRCVARGRNPSSKNELGCWSIRGIISSCFSSVAMTDDDTSNPQWALTKCIHRSTSHLDGNKLLGPKRAFAAVFTTNAVPETLNSRKRLTMNLTHCISKNEVLLESQRTGRSLFGDSDRQWRALEEYLSSERQLAKSVPLAFTIAKFNP